MCGGRDWKVRLIHADWNWKTRLVLFLRYLSWMRKSKQLPAFLLNRTALMHVLIPVLPGLLKQIQQTVPADGVLMLFGAPAGKAVAWIQTILLRIADSL